MFDHLWTAAGISAGSISYRDGEWVGYPGILPFDADLCGMLLTPKLHENKGNSVGSCAALPVGLLG